MAMRTMNTHSLNAPKGWPSMSAVDFEAKFDATALAAVNNGVAYAGRCVSLAEDGEYDYGVANANMAMWLFQNSDDPDIKGGDGTVTTDRDAYVAVSPTKVMMALVAAGSYELATTEYESGQTYNPGTPLKAYTRAAAANGGGDVNRAGLVTPGTAGTDAIVGVVSRGVKANSHGVSEVWFWPVYSPAHSHI